MKCTKCNSEISIANSKCPKCGHNLLQFGATSFYESREKDSQGYRQEIKDMVFVGLREKEHELVDSLDAEEIKVFVPILEKKLSTLVLKHLSDEAIERLYSSEIMPILDELARDRNAQLIFKKVESNIKKNLGEAIFQYYQKWPEIIKMLSAGELVYLLIKKEDVDLSVKMFEFFKAGEVACSEHAEKRLCRLINHEIVTDVDRVIGQGSDDVRKDNVVGRDIPDWFDGDRQENIRGHKKAFVILLDMLLERKNKNNLINSRNTGLALYIFGRDSLEIKGKYVTINNIFDARGPMSAREKLARDLCEIQTVRNEKIHDGIAVQKSEVDKWKGKAYDCLQAIPAIMGI